MNRFSSGDKAATAAGALASLAFLFGAVAGTAASATPAPKALTMTDARVAHWAPVVTDVAARRAPAGSAPVVVHVSPVTPERTQNILEILARTRDDHGRTWYEVRLATLPNSQAGWVPASALGNVYRVTTHLYVNRETFTATLKDDGVTVFTTRVGVGRPYWPTPAGQFYIREKLTDLNNPFYGPLAFGTSARSAVLTDWPDGGFIGVHGTNEPGILPGAVSHGCIRMTNNAIVQLAKLMPVGTPLTIT